MVSLRLAGSCEHATPTVMIAMHDSTVAVMILAVMPMCACLSYGHLINALGRIIESDVCNACHLRRINVRIAHVDAQPFSDGLLLSSCKLPFGASCLLL